MEQELKIKLSLDNTPADRSLDEFGQKADRATGRAADGMKQVDRASRGAAGGVKSMGKAFGSANQEIAGLIKAQMGLGAIKNIAAGIASEMEKAAENVGRVSREWQQFRKSLQGVSSLEGKSNSNAFAAEEVNRAERARVTPKEAQQFREAFLSKASLYVGEGPAAKMSSTDADELQSKLMEYAASKGIGQQEMADFAGGLLAQQKGKISGKDMMARVGRTFATLEASSAPVAHLLPPMTRVMAQGMSAEDASRDLAAMPEIAPEEEGTYLLRVLSEMRRVNVEGKGTEYGMKEGMTPQQQLEALVANLKQRGGGNAKQLDKAIREFTHEDVAANTLRGMVNQVDFDQWKNVQSGVSDDALQKTLEADRNSDAGKQRFVESGLAIEQARMGMRNDRLERLRQGAEADLTKAGRFDSPSWAEYGRGLVPGSSDMKTIMVNRQAISAARAELGESPGLGDNVAAQSLAMTNDLLRQLIERIDQQTDKLAAIGGGFATQVPAPMPGRPAAIPVRP